MPLLVTSAVCLLYFVLRTWIMISYLTPFFFFFFFWRFPLHMLNFTSIFSTRGQNLNYYGHFAKFLKMLIGLCGG